MRNALERIKYFFDTFGHANDIFSFRTRAPSIIHFFCNRRYLLQSLICFLYHFLADCVVASMNGVCQIAQMKLDISELRSFLYEQIQRLRQFRRRFFNGFPTT